MTESTGPDWRDILDAAEEMVAAIKAAEATGVSIGVLANAFSVRAEAERLELLAVCKRQHAALDMLFAMLAARAPRAEPFFPSRTGEPWDARAAAAEVINRVTDRVDFGRAFADCVLPGFCECAARGYPRADETRKQCLVPDINRTAREIGWTEPYPQADAVLKE